MGNFVSEEKENIAEGVHWALDPKLIAHLKKMDVNRFVGGHKPVGETGAIYRTFDKKYMAIDLDMNFAKGLSYARIEVHRKEEIVGMLGEETKETCKAQELTDCAKEYRQTIAVGNASPVGFELKYDGAIWKSRVEINYRLLLSKGEGRDKLFQWVTLNDIFADFDYQITRAMSSPSLMSQFKGMYRRLFTNDKMY